MELVAVVGSWLLEDLLLTIVEVVVAEVYILQVVRIFFPRPFKGTIILPYV